MSNASLAPAGHLGMQVIRRWPHATTVRSIIKHGLPWFGNPSEVNVWRFKNIPNLWRGFWRILIAKVFRIPTHYGALYLDVIDAEGRRTAYGLASLRVVTDTGVAFIVDAFQNSVELENMKYHGFGTGGTAEGASQTALVTELTTEYASDNTRPTGTTTEGATANIYRTVATLDPDSAVAITEHGVFDQAANSGGVMIDRSLFAAVNLAASGDTLQATYDLTFASGS